jgi:ABC-type dipeptide/oligopeptide/nickel transport system permease subunit
MSRLLSARAPGLAPGAGPVPGARRYDLFGAFRRKQVGYAERVAVVLIGILTVALFAAQWIAPHSASEIVGTAFTPPSAEAPFGTDSQGRDVLSRVILGLQASWFGALGVIAFGVVFGGALGLVAGMAGGVVDTVLMRLTDAALALPGTLVALMVVAALGPSLQNTLIAVAVTWWPWYARIVRGSTRSIVHLPHVDAARLGGFSKVRLAVVHVLPGSIGPVLVAASLDVGGVLLVLASLSFIGLGSPAPAAEIGSMAADGLTYLFNAPYIALAPALALFTVAFVANYAGDALRELTE